MASEASPVLGVLEDVEDVALGILVRASCSISTRPSRHSVVPSCFRCGVPSGSRLRSVLSTEPASTCAAVATSSRFSAAAKSGHTRVCRARRNRRPAPARILPMAATQRGSRRNSRNRSHSAAEISDFHKRSFAHGLPPNGQSREERTKGGHCPSQDRRRHRLRSDKPPAGLRPASRRRARRSTRPGLCKAVACA